MGGANAIGSILESNRTARKEMMAQTMNIGRRSALGLAAVLIIAGSIVSVPSEARAADQGSGKILYQYVSDLAFGDIHSVNADGTDDRTLWKDDSSHGVSWSPDGKQILFLHDSSQHQTEFYVMNRDGSNPHLLRRQLEGFVESASWSPDGKTLALAYRPKQWIVRSTPGQPAPAPGFFLLSVDGHDEPRLIRENAWDVKWSPDGKKVVFGVNPSPGRWSVHIADADGSNDLPLIGSDFGYDEVGGTVWPSPPEGAAWSPDGRQIALVARTTTQHGIFIVNSDGSALRFVAANWEEWRCYHPSWSPDGRQIAFSCVAMPACQGVAPGNLLQNQKPGPCVQPLFVIPVNDPSAKPIRLTEHNALFPEFAPR
jgi:Tol biopolymer transport system component